MPNEYIIGLEIGASVDVMAESKSEAREKAIDMVTEMFESMGINAVVGAVD